MARAEQQASPAVDVDGALAGLVHQFGDPLAFLRELVQNSIDAASSRAAKPKA